MAERIHVLAIDQDGDHRALCGATSAVLWVNHAPPYTCKRCLAIMGSKAQARRDMFDAATRARRGR